MTYSDEQLLEEIHQLAEALGHPPTLQDMRDEGKYAAMTYYNRFGSWQQALNTAGFESREPNDRIPTEKLVQELRRISEEVSSPPTAKEMNKHGSYWASTYRRRFGSWANALRAAGIDPPDTTVSDADLLAELRRLADELNEPPTYTDMEQKGAHGAMTYVRRFGSWNAALKAGRFSPRTSSNLTDDELLIELRRLADQLDDRPSTRDMDNYGEYSSATYQRHFGSWTAALEVAFEDYNPSG